MIQFRWCRIFVVMLVCVSTGSAALAQGTAFTYQGRLNDLVGPASGTYDIRFVVCDAVTNGNAVAGGVTNSAVAVAKGLFTVTLDFGSGIFTGSNYWLELAVQTNGGGGFTTLSPRQPIMPSPYAIYAANAGSATTASIAGTASSISATNITDTIHIANLPYIPLGLASNAASASVATYVTSSPLTNAVTNYSGTVPLENLPEIIVTNGTSTVTWGSDVTGFQIHTDPVRVPNIPVAILQPAVSNSAMVLDLWPSSSNGDNPSNSDGLQGSVMLDLVDRNLATSADTNTWQAFVMAIGPTAATFGTHSQGTNPPLPITFWGPNSGAAYTFTTCGPGASSQVARFRMTADNFGLPTGQWCVWGSGSGFDGYVFATAPMVTSGGVDFYGGSETILSSTVGLNWKSTGLLEVNSGQTAGGNGSLLVGSNLFVGNTLIATNGIASGATNYGTFTGNWTNTFGINVAVTMSNGTRVAVFNQLGANVIPAGVNPVSFILLPSAWTTNSAGTGYYYAQ